MGEQWDQLLIIFNLDGGGGGGDMWPEEDGGHVMSRGRRMGWHGWEEHHHAEGRNQQYYYGNVPKGSNPQVIQQKYSKRKQPTRNTTVIFIMYLPQE